MNRTLASTAIAAFTLVSVLAGSCGSKKVAVAQPPAEVSTDVIIIHSGTIMLGAAAEGCPLLLRLDPEKEGEWLLPIALDEQYLKEGLRLKFSYRPSRASSGSCTKGTPVILENIHVMELK